MVERQLHRIVNVPRWFGPSCQPIFMLFSSEEDVEFWASASAMKAPSKADDNHEAVMLLIWGRVYSYALGNAQMLK
jgi:hypothetical protein